MIRKRTTPSIEKRYTKRRAALRRAWGPELFDRRIVLADRAISKIVSDEGVKFIKNLGLAGHPIILKFFAFIGEHAVEDGCISVGKRAKRKKIFS